MGAPGAFDGRPRADKMPRCAIMSHKCAKLRRTQWARCVAAAGQFVSEIKQRAGGHTLTWQQTNTPPSADRHRNVTFIGLNAQVDLISFVSPCSCAANAWVMYGRINTIQAAI